MTRFTRLGRMMPTTALALGPNAVWAKDVREELGEAALKLAIRP